jgi:effector-binding domain-containing protein
MSNTTKKKPFVLPAHMVAVTIIPFVTEAYDTLRPKLVKWMADRQYKKFVQNIETYVKNHS